MNSREQDSAQDEQAPEPDPFWQTSYSRLKELRRVVGGLALLGGVWSFLEPAGLTGVLLGICRGSFVLALIGLLWSATLHRAAIGYTTRARWWICSSWQDDEQKLGQWAVRSTIFFMFLFGYGVLLLLLGMRW